MTKKLLKVKLVASASCRSTWLDSGPTLPAVGTRNQQYWWRPDIVPTRATFTYWHCLRRRDASRHDTLHHHTQCWPHIKYEDLWLTFIEGDFGAAIATTLASLLSSNRMNSLAKYVVADFDRHHHCLRRRRHTRAVQIWFSLNLRSNSSSCHCHNEEYDDDDNNNVKHEI